MATNDVVVALADLMERSALERELADQDDIALHLVDSGEELWRACRDRVADLAVLDSALDGVEGGGLALCRKLKTRPSTRHISVLLVCGRHELLRATDGADGRPDEVLLRPLHGGEALLRLRSLLRLRRYAAQLVEASRLDPLTSVFTRAHLLERLGHELARAERYGRSLALLLLDLDEFAAINHDLGATRGDLVLREVARALVSRVRGVDLVARSGDDEFAVVLPETSLLVARPVAERLKAAVNSVELEGDGRLDSPREGPAGPVDRIRCSIGVAGFPHPAVADVPELLRCAREALASARERGGDRVTLR